MPTQRATAETRHAIVESEAELLRDRGASGLNVRAIMERAEISRTTFYRQFSDPCEVVEQPIAELVAHVARPGGALLCEPGTGSGLAKRRAGHAPMPRPGSGHGADWAGFWGDRVMPIVKAGTVIGWQRRLCPSRSANAVSLRGQGSAVQGGLKSALRRGGAAVGAAGRSAQRWAVDL